MDKNFWLCAASLPMLCCGSLFGEPPPPPPPATTAALLPVVTLPSRLDCTGAGTTPLSVSWGVKPIQLGSGAIGLDKEFSTSELLQNTSGSATDCYYTPAMSVSAASGNGLRPGSWQITLTHNVSGFPNPIVCTRQLFAGGNQLVFVIGFQTGSCL